MAGEHRLADALRAVARLPRRRALVRAGSLSEAADLVVTDPVQAGDRR